MAEKPAFVDSRKQFTTEVFSFHLPLFLKEFILFYFIFKLLSDKTIQESCLLGPAQHTAQRIRPLKQTVDLDNPNSAYIQASRLVIWLP